MGTETTNKDGAFTIRIISTVLRAKEQQLKLTLSKTTAGVEHKFEFGNVPITSKCVCDLPGFAARGHLARVASLFGAVHM